MSDTVKKKLERVHYYGGLEGVLSVVAWTVLILGIVAFVFVWIVAADSGNGLAGFLAGTGHLVSGLVVWAVLRALGEIIRLQKKAAGLNYGGKISEPGEEKLYSCATCGEFLQGATWCYRCGMAVESEAEESDPPGD